MDEAPSRPRKARNITLYADMAMGGQTLTLQPFRHSFG
jgi:hypothetical protein